MLLPTHNGEWRERWVSITDALEATLMSETPDAERVGELLRDRQHHLTAHKNVVPDTSKLSASQQSAWVEAMLERDLTLMTKVVELMEGNTRSLESYQANKRALKRLRLNSISPQRHYVVTGHL